MGVGIYKLLTVKLFSLQTGETGDNSRRSARTALTNRARLLVLGVVGRVDGAHEKLEQPELGGQVDARLAHHLGLLRLVVGGAVDEVADLRMVVERLEEGLRLLVVADLGEL